MQRTTKQAAKPQIPRFPRIRDCIEQSSFHVSIETQNKQKENDIWNE